MMPMTSTMVKTTQRKTMKQRRRSHSISSVMTNTAASASAMLRRSSCPVDSCGENESFDISNIDYMLSIPVIKEMFMCFF